MPQGRLSVRTIREVLRLHWAQGLSQRQIAESCAIGKGTVGEYLRRASDVGLRWPLPDEMTESALRSLLFPAPPTAGADRRPVPDLDQVHQELRKKGVTLMLLWVEHRRQHPDGFGYSRFCEMYQEWKKRQDTWMVQSHRAGERLFVDYAGVTVPILDRLSGDSLNAQIFVATLGASSYTYAEATPTQSIEDWVGSHVRAFEFFGGVPELLVPDNLKVGVTSACRYEPDLNPTYHALAVHYDTAILPARVRKPRDKAKVESGVQQVERWVLAPLRHCTFFSCAELNAAMREPLAALNDRTLTHKEVSRRALFETLDRPAMKPLPEGRFQIVTIRKARVHPDCHVEVDRHYYSVPFRLARQLVEVHLTTEMAEVFHNGDRVASHIRSRDVGCYTTLLEHLPPRYRGYSGRDVERLYQRAHGIGPATEAVLRGLMARRVHPEQGIRSCQGILHLAEKHGAQRLERASQRALQAGSFSRRFIDGVLRNHLEDEPSAQLELLSAPIQHANVRGPGYYRQ